MGLCDCTWDRVRALSLCVLRLANRMLRDAIHKVQGLALPVWDELKYNSKASGTALLLDIFALFACMTLFYLNDLVLIDSVSRSFPDSVVSYLFKCHVIDAIGGCAFMAYTNCLLDLVKPEMRFKRLASTLVYMSLCGIFWELIAPLFVRESVGDFLDIVAYLFGACLYLLLTKAVLRPAREEATDGEGRELS